MPASRLRLRLVVMPLAWLVQGFRLALPWALLGLLVFAGWRYFSRPLAVGALEFTPHSVNGATTAIGVQGMAGVDVDGDGDIDIETTGLDGTKLYINDGQEKFKTNLIDDKDGERIQVIDLNKDGTQDLLVTLKGQNPSVIWYDNRGGLEFNENSIGTGTDALAYAGDLNGDGQPDIATAMNSGGNILLQRWMGSNGSFTATTLDSNSGVTAVTIANVNGDGYNDIVIGGSKGLQRWQTTDGTSWSRIDIDDANQNKTHLVAADIDNDGKTDIVTADANKDLVVWYKNLDNSTWKRNVLTGDADAKTVAVRDVDEDGDEDIVATSQDEGTVYWYENNGKSEFTRRTIATGLPQVYGVAVADVDDDGDFDFVTGDSGRGTVWWYERLRAKPVATKPTNIQQASDGSGRVTFETTLSDADSDPTRLRVQYSTDGVRWDKPWLTKVKASAGKVDLKNKNGYQVGTKDAIDTTNSEEVTLTFTWDTKSAENTGGPLSGDVGNVRLRLIPRDDVSVGETVVSSAFRVDLAPPRGLSLTLSSITESEATLTWSKPSDSSEPTYKIYFGVDAQAVLEQRSEVWDQEDDAAMADFENTSTTITGLSANKTYTFKLFATDAFGNSAGAASVQAKAAAAVPAPEATAGAVPAQPTPAATQPTPTATAGTAPPATLTPTALPTPTLPTTLSDNRAPTSDAGPNQVVNPSALVILDGTASFDLDRDSLTYTWRQLAGPRVDLLSARTATPSFSAGSAGGSYVFQLTTRDPRGALGIDTVTVAVKDLPEPTTVPVRLESPEAETTQTMPRSSHNLLYWLNLALFLASVLATSVSLSSRISHRFRARRFFFPGPSVSEGGGGKVVHYQTAEAIAGAHVLIYGEDGKLKRSERTNDKGEFPTLLPAGRYTLDVRAEGFSFAPASTRLPLPDPAVLYTGGVLSVPSGKRAMNMVVPMRPTGKPVGGARARALHLWQIIQRVGRWLSWPLFLAGVLLNTFLVFRSPSALYLALEILYVVLVIIKVVLEVRMRPAYGLVRDGLTHVPLDLAVVRLYEAGTNRLMMTRVTNAQGKFFALPSSGVYTVTITKPGYAVFSRPNIEITSQQDSALQITADLIPVAPVSGLAGARAGAL